MSQPAATNPHTTAARLADLAPQLPEGAFRTVAQIYEHRWPGAWPSIHLKDRQQIGKAFRRAIELGINSPDSGWRPVGKSGRDQTVYEVVHHRKTGSAS